MVAHYYENKLACSTTSYRALKVARMGVVIWIRSYVPVGYVIAQRRRCYIDEYVTNSNAVSDSSVGEGFSLEFVAEQYSI